MPFVKKIISWIWNGGGGSDNFLHVLTLVYIPSVGNGNGNRRGHEILFTDKFLVEHKFGIGGRGSGGGGFGIIVIIGFFLLLFIIAKPLKLVIIFEAKPVENGTE